MRYTSTTTETIAPIMLSALIMFSAVIALGSSGIVSQVLQPPHKGEHHEEEANDRTHVEQVEHEDEDYRRFDGGRKRIARTVINIP